MPKILFLVLHRKDRSPGQRYRHEQFVEYLESQGNECVFSPLLTESDDKAFYSSGNHLKKVFIGIKTFLRRLGDVRRCVNFDHVYIYRDAYFFGSFIESWIAKRAKHVIYDFDDAIWLMDDNPNQGIFNRLKTPNKIGRIISISDSIITGNNYLADYANQFNRSISIIPSTIDLDKYEIISQRDTDQICIGWTGSFSTIKHFEMAIPALLKIKYSFGKKVRFKLIGDSNYHNEELDLNGEEWKSETEAKDLSELDIGIMPLPDNQWTQGKCGMKGLQYMAIEIPTIMSPVGVNSDIIQDGENGFLASTTEEWVEKLSLLIEDASLRKKLGKAGRKTVEEHYSVEANKDKWLKVFS